MIDITSGLSDEQMQDMLRSEHGGLNETFADVAEITGDKKYLELARRFSHKLILDPLIKEEDKLTGMHANTQIPKVIGYKRIAELSQDDKIGIMLQNGIMPPVFLEHGSQSPFRLHRRK